MERGSAPHRPHRKNLHFGPLADDIGIGFIPIDLSFLAKLIVLRNEGLPPLQPHRPFASPDVVPHCRLRHRHGRELRDYSAIDASGRVALFARRTPVLVKNLVNERHHSVQLRLDPCRIPMRRRQRTSDRLPHHSTVHAKFGRYPRDRSNTELVLLTELLKQFHSGDPIHSEPPGKTRATVG